jgi:hypothetical protein
MRLHQHENRVTSQHFKKSESLQRLLFWGRRSEELIISTFSTGQRVVMNVQLYAVIQEYLLISVIITPSVTIVLNKSNFLLICTTQISECSGH